MADMDVVDATLAELLSTAHIASDPAKAKGTAAAIGPPASRAMQPATVTIVSSKRKVATKAPVPRQPVGPNTGRPTSALIAAMRNASPRSLSARRPGTQQSATAAGSGRMAVAYRRKMQHNAELIHKLKQERLSLLLDEEARSKVDRKRLQTASRRKEYDSTVLAEHRRGHRQVSEAATIKHVDGPTLTLSFCQKGGHHLVSEEPYEQSVTLWDWEAKRIVRSFPAVPSAVCAMASSPDGGHFASGSSDGHVELYDADTIEHIGRLHGRHPVPVLCVAYSADGTRIASGGADGRIMLWDVATGRCVGTLRGHAGFVLSLVHSPDGRLLASGGQDRTARVWQLADEEADNCELSTIKNLPGPVLSIQFGQKRSSLLLGTHAGEVKLRFDA